MQLTLSEDLEGFIRDQVATGRFVSESAVVELAIRQMRDRAKRLAEVQRAMLEDDLLDPVGQRG